MAGENIVTPNLPAGLTSPVSTAAGPISAPTPAAPPAEATTPAMAPPDVTDRSINPAQPPTPPPGAGAGGHQRLLSMIQGLSIGLSAAATSIATHGKEGGAAEVIQIQQGQKAAQREQQAFQTAQKNAQLQQQLTTAETNRVNGQNMVLFGTLHDQQQKSHFETQEAKINTQAKAQDFFRQNGTAPEGWDIDPQTGQAFEKSTNVPAGTTPSNGGPAATPTPGNASTPNLLPGVTPGAPASNASAPNASALATGPSIYDRRQNMILDTAIVPKLGATDPDYLQAKKVLADPTSTIFQKQQAMNNVQMKAGLQEGAIKDLTAKADLQAKEEANLANSSVGKLSTPEVLANPGAQAAIQAKINDPKTDPADIPRLRALLPQAAVAQFNAEQIKEREARNQKEVEQGNPETAGRLLADRSLTLPELKARSVTPKFIQDAIVAAQKIDPTYKAANEEAQARIAASPGNAQFFGNTDSLLVKGGTLDQLAQAHAALGNTTIPFANKLENWLKAQLGQGPQAAFAASVLGVADDYAKVISGGAGSDQARQQALDIIGRDLSSEGMAASLAQLRKTVESQRNGRVGTNPYMRAMYPDPSTRQETAGVAGTQPVTARAADYPRPANVPPTAKLMQAPGGQPHWMVTPSQIAAATKLGATEIQ